MRSRMTELLSPARFGTWLELAWSYFLRIIRLVTEAASLKAVPVVKQGSHVYNSSKALVSEAAMVKTRFMVGLLSLCPAHTIRSSDMAPCE